MLPSDNPDPPGKWTLKWGEREGEGGRERVGEGEREREIFDANFIVLL